MERRRAPRAAVGSGCWLILSSSWPVKLLDVSLGGVSMLSPYVPAPGRTAGISTTITGTVFSCQVEVRWIRRLPLISPSGQHLEAGARFAPLDQEECRVLRGLLKLPPSE